MINDYISIWTLIRSSGFLAYFFMTTSLAIGLVSSFTVMKKKKAYLLSLHQISGWYGLLTIIFHLMLIWRDQYVLYSIPELFVPLLANNQPIYSALGTLSFYLFFIVMISSDFFIKKLGIKNWKKLHLAVFPAWVLMVSHGLLIGTDSTERWALVLYTGSISLIFVLSLLKYIETIMHGSETKQGKLKN